MALLSHYVLDSLPHFGVSEDTEIRNGSKFFKSVVTIDTLLFVASWIAVPILCSSARVPVWLILACMGAAFLPDLAWLYRFYKEQHSHADKKRKMHILNHLHHKLQWGERPWGVFIEVIWFGWAVTALSIIR